MPSQEVTWHVKTVAGKTAKDPYAQPSTLSKQGACGCLIAACGFVIPTSGCIFHSESPEVNVGHIWGHMAISCPGAPVDKSSPYSQERLF